MAKYLSRYCKQTILPLQRNRFETFIFRVHDYSIASQSHGATKWAIGPVQIAMAMQMRAALTDREYRFAVHEHHGDSICSPGREQSTQLDAFEDERTVGAAETEGVGHGHIDFHRPCDIGHIVQIARRVLVGKIDSWRCDLILHRQQ